MKCGYLNFLEPCGPLRACNGTILPLPFTAMKLNIFKICSSKILQISLVLMFIYYKVNSTAVLGSAELEISFHFNNYVPY